MKLHEASAFGLPSVVTPLIANQVGWVDRSECLIGADAEDFARKVVELYRDPALWGRIRSAALRAVERECSRESFLAGLRAATTPIGRPTDVPASASPSLMAVRSHP
jgi:glycosyltransferase involved in cell wall biosynthesis